MSDEKKTQPLISSPMMPWIEARNHFLPIVAVGVAFGIFIALLFSSSTIMLLLFAIVSAVGIAVSVRKTPTTLLVALFLCASLLGASRVSIHEHSISQMLYAFENTEVLLEGVVTKDPEHLETYTRVTVAADSINDQAVEGVVLVRADRFIPVLYGDHVRIKGILEKPTTFETDSGRSFNYEEFLNAKRITHIISFADVTVMGHGRGSSVMSSLIAIKSSLVSRIESLFPDPEGPLLSGLLLGERQALGPDVYAAFQRAGVVHMIVLSGYNVSLVVQALLLITSRVLPRLASISVASLGIIAFALMTGASETTVRASLMAGVLIVAQVLRRPHDAFRALLIAGLIMLLVNPHILLYDLSFQLSFIATAGILFLSKPLSRALSFLPEQFGFREVGASTLAAQIAVLPILITSVGNVSLVSPLTNLLVIVALPWAMLLGFISALASYIHVWIAAPFSFITYGILVYIVQVSVWFGNLPFAAVAIPKELTTVLLIVLSICYFFLMKRLMRESALK